jgi:hypothetical protein
VAALRDDHDQAYTVPTLFAGFLRWMIGKRHNADGRRVKVKMFQQILANLEG